MSSRHPCPGLTDRLCRPALADLNGDSTPEIIVQTNDGLNCWYGDGSICPGWPQVWQKAYTGGYYEQGNSSPVIGDIDGDSQPDIVITIHDWLHYGDSYRPGEIRVYNRNGVLHPDFPKTLSKLGSGAVSAIADIDLDGRNEIIVAGDFWEGIADYYDKVWVYDLGGPQHGKIEWGQFGGGPQHRGVYPPPNPISGIDL